MNDSFKLSKSAKRFMSTMSKAERATYLKVIAPTEFQYEKTEWAVMAYDVSPNGKRPSKKNDKQG